ncbi:tannase/feruloyl esterase family alpha/beta hydrolase [Agromyces albus]|uniref:tannase/feruloyl esterase family alpha/beta hydrolase n=1 Tax=Agromyces albus TaxID=205332 RepID=UPI00278163BB|nr:tannase/feruloyl esterase family alpha/beta hydrolase [Agromyces albus]MDQ0576237.1 pimeloyl-ACP methyl ester carboxylesterase [Agromyces albus]
MQSPAVTVVGTEVTAMMRGGIRAVTLGAAAVVALMISGAAAAAAAVPVAPSTAIPQLSPAEPGTLGECESLIAFEYDSTVITGAEIIAAGTLSGVEVGEHCLVRGHMNERFSEVDGQAYRIGFEMRLPTDWSGRYLYQGNGGLDGNVATALGNAGSESGLQLGFAVISSDAGHPGSMGPTFGIDPQARLDYGYQAVGTLTPMAKALIEAAYGKSPDRSYMTGGSNGGRHTMVGAARYADQYDGFLAVAPGFNLPQAAVAQVWGAQQWVTVATDAADLNTALTPAERRVIADAILARCDGLDRIEDGMVQDSERCQKAFSIDRDVPTCEVDRDGTCLTAEQKSVVSDVFAGARTSEGEEIYSSFPFDPGLAQGNWAFWKFFASRSLDPGAIGFIFGTPPDPSIPASPLTVDIDAVAQSISATSGIYTESGMEFMTPPDPTRLDTLRERGGKMIVVHGASDGVFSVDDTGSWYDELDANYGQKADQFARYFEVPGMGHVRGGPATDQYEGLTALIDWVEYGSAPDRIDAWVNPANADVPASWSADLSRPLCPFPSVAQYASGDPDSADSFVCKHSGGGIGRG